MDRFNKDKSVQLKGVAIIFMFWLHLYGHDNLIQDGNYYTELWGGGNAIPSYTCILYTYDPAYDPENV